MPRNTRAALVEIYASGTANEEFWYTSVSDALYDKLPPATVSALNLFPRGPVREVQVRVDNKLAGFAQPLAIIFTGGIDPSLWSPLVSFGAFNQPTYTLDLTPFVPLLADGKHHNVSLSVVSAEKNGTIDASWFISGNIQASLDPTGKPTTGKIVHYEGDDLPFSSLETHAKVTSNETFTFSIESWRPRTLKIETLLQAGSDSAPKRIWWEQSSTIFCNKTSYNHGKSQYNVVNSTGYAQSSHDGRTFFSYNWDLPLTVSTSANDFSFKAQIFKRYDTHLTSNDPRMGLPEWTRISTSQTSNGEIDANAEGQIETITGKALQNYQYADANKNTFERTTSAWNFDGVTVGINYDHVSGSLAKNAAPISNPTTLR